MVCNPCLAKFRATAKAATEAKGGSVKRFQVADTFMSVHSSVNLQEAVDFLEESLLD